MKLNRYPGAKPFTANYKDLFFGRDKDIEALSKHITVEKMTVLYGKSGLGKSSLLNAGVLPKLTAAGCMPFHIHFNSYIEGANTSPTDISVQRLTGGKPLENFLQKVEDENISLWQYVKGLELAGVELSEGTWTTAEGATADRTTATILLIFDQFEELFTYPEERVDAFAQGFGELLDNRMPKSFRRNLRRLLAAAPDALSEAEQHFLEEDLPLKVVFSVRSDRLNLLNRLTTYIPNVLQNCYELLPLDKEQAQAAIKKPAQMGGDFASPKFSYEAEALQHITAYLSQGKSKAVESFQLQIICQYIESKIVIDRQDTYVEMSDLGNLEDITQNYYTAILGKVADKTQTQVLVEEQLIREERRISLDEAVCRTFIGNETLNRLVDKGLLRSEPNTTGGFSYELSHDTLVAPILKSKEVRVAEEYRTAEAVRATAEAEQERQKLADERLEREKVQKQLRTVRVLLGIAVIALMMAVALGFWAYQAEQATLTLLEKMGVTETHFAEMAMNQFEFDRALQHIRNATLSQDKEVKKKIKVVLADFLIISMYKHPRQECREKLGPYFSAFRKVGNEVQVNFEENGEAVLFAGFEKAVVLLSEETRTTAARSELIKAMTQKLGKEVMQPALNNYFTPWVK